jgi:hypothetical protein
MNVTIEQRQKAGGLFWQRDEYYVDCAVEFSDLERKRIDQDPERFLTYVVSAGYDAPSESLHSPRNIKRGTFFLLFMALLLFASSFPNTSWSGNGDVILLLAAAMGSWLYGTWFDYEGVPASDEIALGAIVNQPRLVLYARTRELAQQTAADLRERLTRLEAMLASG